MSVSYIVSNSKSITLYLGSTPYAVEPEHPLYHRIVAALREGDEDVLKDLLTNPVSGVAEFIDGKVIWEGRVLHNVLVDRIMEHVRIGLSPEPMLRFLENVMANPSEQSREELYEFLAHRNLPITEDGCFLGYKSIRMDWFDHHSGQFDNSPGAVISMPRAEVDPDRSNHCSYGFHVGTVDYVAGFHPGASRHILVKVNPKDAVSVPPDCQAQKLRCCRYEVMAEIKQDVSLDFPSYSADGSRQSEVAIHYCDDAQFDDTDFDSWDDKENEYLEDLWEKKMIEESAEEEEEEEDYIAERVTYYEKGFTRDWIVDEAYSRGLVKSVDVGRALRKAGCISLLAHEDAKVFFNVK